MATLKPTTPEIAAEFQQRAGESFDDYMQRSDAAFKVLQARSLALPPGEYTGALLRWQVCDGYAYYRVTSAKPLQLEHLDVMDGYTVDAATIRGIRLADVERQLAQAQAWARLFAKKK